MTLKFRPHHFLCTLGFQGKGYSDEFVQNYQEISDQLKLSKDGDDTLLTTVTTTDSICSPCPNRRELLCTQEEKIRTLDQNHMKQMGWKAGETLSWGEAKKRIQKTMSLEAFHQICAPCSWRSLGVCENSLKELLKKCALLLLAGFFFFSSSTTLALDEGKKIADLESLFSKKKYDAVIQKGASNLDRLSDYGHYYVGESYLKKKNFEAAAKEFRHVITEHPLSALHKIAETELSTAELEQAKSFSKTKKAVARKTFERAFSRLLAINELYRVDAASLKAYDKICDKNCKLWMIKLASQFPKASVEAEAMGESYELKSSVTKAQFSKLSQSYKTPDADQQAFDQAMFLYFGNERKKSKEAFTSFLEQFPKSSLRHRVRYLIGKLAMLDNQPTLAHEAFDRLMRDAPLTYYGLAAAFELSVPIEAQFSAEVPELTDTDSNLTPSEQQKIQRTEELLKAHAIQAAQIESKDLKPRDPFSSAILFYLSDLETRTRNHSVAFQHLNELIQRGDSRVYTSYALRMVFPEAYWKEIQKIGDEIDLDPYLILSLTKQESAFDSNAVSSSGAMGMMQLMPFTAIDVNPELARLELFDPLVNIRTGATYLKRLVVKYHGNWAKSLAAYNAGPGAVDRWVREAKADKDLAYFIEAIPFKETQGYVAAIARNYYWYKSRIQGEKLTNLQMFWNETKH